MKLEFNGYIRNTDYNYIYNFNIEKMNSIQVLKMKELGRITKKVKIIIEEPILDEEERKYLSDVIRPFRDRVTDIIKYKNYDFENKEYIVIHCNQFEKMMFPYFKKGTMYRNLELNKEYTLEELGL